MKTIIYCRDGLAVADEDTFQVAGEFFASEAEIISVSTENFILAARVLIKEGKFPFDQIKFSYNQQSYSVDSRARFTSYPSGFCDFSELCLCRLLA